MPVWFWIVGAGLLGGAAWYGHRQGLSVADQQGSAYDSGASASSLLDYGISPSGNSDYTGYGGSFVINPSIIAPSSGGATTPVAPGPAAQNQVIKSRGGVAFGPPPAGVAF